MYPTSPTRASTQNPLGDFTVESSIRHQANPKYTDANTQSVSV